ncbi:MAG TPA: enolase C-terminal domain-like protein [Ktedonobacterales bacterium]|nr:enolase C-terminal domain-like protein [Ktedonobacterales bacterium]HEX5570883.1 enolase C-terminal domain-like protein [Ktedonobacterales bacterium]
MPASTLTRGASTAKIEKLEVAAYTIPTDYPEADGTYAWKATTLVAVHVRAGGRTGFGYSYADTATATLIRDLLASVAVGRDALDVPGAWVALVEAIRNLGRPGVSSMAIAAVDTALWDLKAKLLDLPLCLLLGRVRDEVPIYGSGGFTSYPIERLQEQLGGWARQGIPRVKMKIGTHPEDDVARVRAAREAIGPQTQLYVDANGAYTRTQALAQAERFAELGVVWFEEPVSSDDLAGLHFIRDRAPAGMAIAAGEYGYDQWYFRRMLDAGAVDTLQADATRCAGFTGFLRAATLADVHGIQLSAHCAPMLHLHVCTAIQHLSPIEYFHDHVRIARMLFDGTPEPVGGALRPDLSRPGIGLELKQADAKRYAV